MAVQRLASPLLAALLFSLCGTPVLARGGGGGGGGGFHGGGSFGGGGGGGFRGGDFGGGGGGGGAYRFSAPRVESAPVERAAPIGGGGGGYHGGGGGGYHGGSGGGGGGHVSSWSDKPAERSLDQGYKGSHPLYGSGTRSAWTGHNISSDQFRRMNDGSWNVNRSFDNDRFNRNINVDNNFYNRDYGGWNNAWNDGGYWGSRPWGYGWYDWSPNSWGWWGGSSVGWGLAALATGEVITELVNDAAEQQSPVIDVPESNYQLNYGTVDAVGSSGADFSYAVAGSPPLKGAANCQQGLLDGQVPSTAAQAQLLNAACQVAYGPDPKGTPLPESLAGRLPGWLRDLLVLALGGGIGVGTWQLLERRRNQASQGPVEHHATVTTS